MFVFCIENGQSKTLKMKFKVPTLMCNPCTFCTIQQGHALGDEWKVFDEKEEFEPFLVSFIGFVQCDIEPSTNLHHPIIGSKDEKSQKYVFDLKRKKKIILTSAEIQVALNYSYKVSKVYKALVHKKHPDLFKTT